MNDTTASIPATPINTANILFELPVSGIVWFVSIPFPFTILLPTPFGVSGSSINGPFVLFPLGSVGIILSSSSNEISVFISSIFISSFPF